MCLLSPNVRLGLLGDDGRPHEQVGHLEVDDAGRRWVAAAADLGESRAEMRFDPALEQFSSLPNLDDLSALRHGASCEHDSSWGVGLRVA